MKQISKVFLACACSLSGLTTQAQDQTVWSNDFSNASQPLNTVGRGVCRVNDGVFHSRSAYALFGNPEWKDYTLSFKARAPKDAEQVQIWAGFRTHNRFSCVVSAMRYSSTLTPLRASSANGVTVRSSNSVSIHPPPSATSPVGARLLFLSSKSM